MKVQGYGMKRAPTERQAALAARQLLYHREKLHWIQTRMNENEALLRFYLTRLETNVVVLPGGFHVAGNPATTRELTIEKLAPKNLYEQLAFSVGREVA
ncbi:hypothetical protein BH24ACT20_BH24ACT20_00360 [soil metagenome]